VFIQSIAQQTDAKKVTITFHGGEPLLAPLAVWEVLLKSIEERLGGYQLKLGLQSNLWRLDDGFLALFAKHQLSIGTSLDGPEQLCDLNRGQGYFARTSAAMQRARDAGFAVSAIATMTRQTLPQARTVADYFCDQGTPMVLHGALAALDKSNSGFALSADEYAQLVIGLYPWYLENRKLIQIETLDHYLRGVVFGNPGVCTLRDCWGMFLAIAPTATSAPASAWPERSSSGWATSSTCPRWRHWAKAPPPSASCSASRRWPGAAAAATATASARAAATITP
jgi:uncharacterized protein